MLRVQDAVRWKQCLKKFYRGEELIRNVTLEKENEVGLENQGDYILRDEFDDAVKS